VENAQWPPVAVMGAGAVGCYFGGMLARAGAAVTLIGRTQHVEAINQSGLLLESSRFTQYVPVSASTDVVAIRQASIVLFCVKTLDTEDAARALLPHLAPDAALVSLQNGVDNIDRIRTATGLEAIPAAVYVGAEMAAPGHVKHTARGDLILGDLSRQGRVSDEKRRRLEAISEMFHRADVPCRVSENVEGDLWAKLLINCAYNAISALCRARYGRIARHASMRDIMRQIVEEGVAVARAAGVGLAEVNYVEAAWKLAESMPGTLSSTAQDIARGKRTEIDSLNGYVARRGAELGVETPVNQTLHALVNLLEESE
jgi:2-dehydropantoate 2-reductase